MRARTVAAVVAALVCGAGCSGGDGQPSGVPHPSVTRPAARAHGVDFDGNGVPDTVATDPQARVDGSRAAGSVTVTYYRADGGSRRQVLRQGHGGLPEKADVDDGFGQSVLTADLDGDGCTDLVVNAPKESWDGKLYAGRSMVLWGGRHGLHDAVIMDRGAARAYDQFAFTAVGDFNADGRADLVRTAGQGESSPSPGRLDDKVLYGPFKRSGRAAGSSTFGPEVSDTAWLVTPVAGDFDADGADDLAAVLSYDDEQFSLLWFRGGRQDGLTGDGEPLPGPAYPAKLSTADMNRDDRPDLVVTDQDGAPSVLYAQRGGPSARKP